MKQTYIKPELVVEVIDNAAILEGLPMDSNPTEDIEEAKYFSHDFFFDEEDFFFPDCRQGQR